MACFFKQVIKQYLSLLTQFVIFNLIVVKYTYSFNKIFQQLANGYVSLLATHFDLCCSKCKD